RAFPVPGRGGVDHRREPVGRRRVDGRMRRVMAGAIALALLAGCGGTVRSAATRPSDWRAVATPGDRDRLRNWRTAWLAAVAKARASGNGAAIDAQSPLFDPDRALPGARPPAGEYRCR